MLNGLSLFSGIGGIDVALAEWVRPVAYCEIEPYAAGVLFSRMDAGVLPAAPIWPDVRTLSKSILPHVDIVYGGFPCQDISCAGRGAGLAGKRSGLFFEILRLVDELKPQFIFLENVPAILTRGGLEATGEIARRGYDCRWTIVSAAEVGAPHLRKRWWLLAHSMRLNERRPQNETDAVRTRRPARMGAENGSVGFDEREPSEALADTESVRRERAGEARNGIGFPEYESPGLSDSNGQSTQRPSISRQERHSWATEPNVGRVVNGLPMRVDRIKGLGNAVVPQAAKEAFKRLMGIN